MTVTVEYIIFSSIFLLFFLFVQTSADEILIEGPGEVVMEDSFSDIGNMMSTTLTDIYLIAPENGRIQTNYNIPPTISGEYYTINADVATTDQIIELESATSERKVNVTISGIASTIPINGTASSSNITHVISYDSTRQ